MGEPPAADDGAPSPGRPAGEAVVRDAVALLWDAVTAGDEHAAGEAVFGALERGVDTESVLLDVIAAVQRRVGEEWAANRLSVAGEHAATAVNDRVIAALAHRLPRPAPVRGRVTVACVDGEWHALPARLLSEVLALRGFQVDYLGAQVPTPHLVGRLHRTGPDVVALSCSLATRLPKAHAAIQACQAAGVPVLAGGAGFGPGGRYARLLGADGWAPDARTAAGQLAGQPLRRRDEAGRREDMPPGPADQEYTGVARDSARLVTSMLAGLEERYPAVRDYDDARLQHTVEDLAHVVEYLATALYVGDGELFTGFLGWTAGVLTSRGVPAHALLPALDTLGQEVRDFPRAARLVAEGRERLAAEHC